MLKTIPRSIDMDAVTKYLSIDTSPLAVVLVHEVSDCTGNVYSTVISVRVVREIQWTSIDDDDRADRPAEEYPGSGCNVR